MKNINKYLIFFCCSLLFLVVFKTQNCFADEPAWIYLGNSEFSEGEAFEMSMSIDASGTPYVVYSDAGENWSENYEITVMKYNGLTWDSVGSPRFSPSGAYYTSIAFDSNNTPYVAYSDENNSYKVRVMKYNGSVWEDVGSVNFSAGRADYISLAIDNNTPYVAYSDYGNGRGATVMKYNGSVWEDVGSVNFSAGRVDYISLAIDNNNTPYVAYRDNSRLNKITVMKYTDLGDTGWENVGPIGFSSGMGSWDDYLDIYKVSIKFDGANIPYVVYSDTNSSYKAMLVKYNGLAWEEVGTSGTGFSGDEAWYTSISFDDNDVPYVVYSDSFNIEGSTVMKYNGLAWEEVGDVNFSDGTAYYTSIFVYNNIPYVAFSYYFNGAGDELEGKATVMRYSSMVSDIIPPSITGLSDDLTPTQSKTWSWDSDDFNATYRYVVNQSATHIFSDEEYGSTKTTTQSSGTGTYYLHVQAKDAANNTSTSTVSAVLDNTSPSITGLSDDLTPTQSKTWSWDSDDSNATYRYVVNQSATHIFSDEEYGSTKTTTQSSGTGTYYLHVQAKDAANNTSTSTVSAVLDNSIEDITQSTTTNFGGVPLYILNMINNQNQQSAAIIINNKIYEGKLVKYLDSSKIYLIQDNKKKWIVNEESFNYYKYDWNKITIIEKDILFTDGLDIDISKQSNKYIFKRNLKLGMTGEDVRELQRYLNNHNFEISKSGYGSKGKETAYFGNSTRNALIKFQKSNNINPSSGYFGAVTREVVNR